MNIDLTKELGAMATAVCRILTVHDGIPMCTVHSIPARGHGAYCDRGIVDVESFTRVVDVAVRGQVVAEIQDRIDDISLRTVDRDSENLGWHLRGLEDARQIACDGTR